VRNLADEATDVTGDAEADEIATYRSSRQVAIAAGMRRRERGGAALSRAVRSFASNLARRIFARKARIRR
jgi:hypothetical protein